MLARKAAEKAKKETQQALLEEHERKKMSAIPEWKRKLLNRKESSDGSDTYAATTGIYGTCSSGTVTPTLRYE